LLDLLQYKGGYSSNIAKSYLKILSDDNSWHHRWKSWCDNPEKEKLLRPSQSIEQCKLVKDIKTDPQVGKENKRS
jgi:hypothetical protein